MTKTVDQILKDNLLQAKDVKVENKTLEGKIEIHFKYKRKKHTIILDELEYSTKYGNNIEIKYSKEFEEYQNEIKKATKPIQDKYKQMLENKNNETKETAQEFSTQVIKKYISENF